MNTPTTIREEEKPTRQKTYVSPTLTEYGTVTELTKGTGGQEADFGGPLPSQPL